MRAKKILILNQFIGLPKESDFQIVEEELPLIKDGEFLSEAIYLSIDPCIKIWNSECELRKTMMGNQLAKIIQSKNCNFPVGKYIVAPFGWRTHTICNGTTQKEPLIIMPNFDDLPLSLGLGMLGKTGMAAYFGFLKICDPKPGETIVISAAAGAVGSHVGQIAKIKGCHVIGIVGSNEKLNWLKTLGFDHVINYKTEDLAEALIKAAPNGIDCYFDNVGGEISSMVIHKMSNMFGRIAVCGSISTYNEDSLNRHKAPMIQRPMINSQLRIEGFSVNRWNDQWMESFNENFKWIKDDKLKYREHITNNFENAPKALIGLFKGENIGKAIVKV